jgi:hypothetical protein
MRYHSDSSDISIENVMAGVQHRHVWDRIQLLPRFNANSGTQPCCGNRLGGPGGRLLPVGSGAVKAPLGDGL